MVKLFSILRSVLSYETQEAQDNNCTFHLLPSTSFHILHQHNTKTNRHNKQADYPKSFFPLLTHNLNIS